MKSAGEMYYWIDCKEWGQGEVSVRRAGVGHVKRAVFCEILGVFRGEDILICDI